MAKELLHKLKEDEAQRRVEAAYAKQRKKNNTRNTRYRMYRDLFDGDESAWWGGDASFFMPAKPVEFRYSLTFNYLAPLVEKWASFIMADEINFAAVPKGPSSKERIEAGKSERICYRLHERSLHKKTLNEIALDASLLGTGWAKTLYDEKDKTRYVYARPEYVYPEPYISVFSGKFRYVIYAYEVHLDDAREEYGSKVGQNQMWDKREKDKETAEDMCSVVEYWSDDSYLLTVGNTVQVSEKNKYGFNPYVQFPLLSDPGKIYGKTWVDWILEPNAYFNQLMSMIADATYLNCNPPTVYENPPANYLDQFGKGGGGVIPAVKDSKIYFLTWPGEPPTVEYLLDRVTGFIHDVSHMPRVAFGDVGAGVNSSRVLSVQYDPVRKVLQQTRDNFDIALKTLNQYLLTLVEKYETNDEITTAYLVSKQKRWNLRKSGAETRAQSLKGKDVAGHYDTVVIWPGVLPKDDWEAARLELEKQSAGVQSKWTTMENLGFANPDDEMETLLEEMEDERLHPKENAGLLTAESRAAQALMKTAPPAEPGGIPERGIMPGEQGPEPAFPSPEEQANSEAQLWQE